MLNWHIISDKEYKNLSISEKTFDKLFYVKDTGRLFCGIMRFMESIVIYKGKEPSTISIGKIYISANTLEGRVWDKNEWVTIINPVRTISESFIDIAEIASSYYIESEGIYLLANNGSKEHIDLNNFFINCIYTLDGDFLISEIYGITDNKKYISMDRCNLFNISFDKFSGMIDIGFLEANSDSISISIKPIIDKLTGTDIAITVTGNSFSAESILYSNDMNVMVNNGYIYAASDINRNTPTLFSLNNSVSTEGDYTSYSINQVTDTLQSSFDRMMKVGSGYTGEIIIADSSGDASPSGVKIGGSKMSQSATDKLVATEKAIVDYVDSNTLKKDKISDSSNIPSNEEDASDEKIASEKSMVKSLSWNILR